MSAIDVNVIDGIACVMADSVKRLKDSLRTLEGNVIDIQTARMIVVELETISKILNEIL